VCCEVEGEAFWGEDVWGEFCEIVGDVLH
jgi:hypothetical protein